jgi:hypothetical protein
MSRVVIRKGDKVFYTEYDGYFTIVKSNGDRLVIPYCEQPELLRKATRLSNFRWEIPY